MRFPGVITVPAFCVHTYFAPGGVSFTVERLWSHPARVCSWQRPLRFDPYTLGARGSEHVWSVRLGRSSSVNGIL
jgi:hypothetical protein